MRSTILFLLSFVATTFASGFSSVPSTPLYKGPVFAKKITLAADTYRNMPLVARGGSLKASEASSGRSGGLAKPLLQLSSSFYGTFGVIYVLVKAIRRVLPVALEPFSEGATPLSNFQLGAYIVTCLWFAWVEGYKGFQTKFSPLVVSRSLTLKPGSSKLHHYLLAPLYSMGLFHATKKRMIVSWSVSIGVATIVYAVKKLPYPWRNIVDAGVVAGLTWGSVSILVQYCKALITGVSPTDPALPLVKP
jgi:hypothetical protein